MAELVVGPDGAVVDGVLHLGADGVVTVEGYRVTTSRTVDGRRYDIVTPSGEQLSWTASDLTASRTLILGGARSGKSTAAERMFADRPDIVYVATGGNDETDPEWTERVARHRARRPATWITLETLDLESLLRETGPPLLIDCLTLWLARTMDQYDVWTALEKQAGGTVETRISELADAWSATRRTVVAVSNEIGSGVVPATASGRLFRDLMGRLNAAIATASDDVLLCVAGRQIRI